MHSGRLTQSARILTKFALPLATLTLGQISYNIVCEILKNIYLQCTYYEIYIIRCTYYYKINISEVGSSPLHLCARVKIEEDCNREIIAASGAQFSIFTAAVSRARPFQFNFSFG